jgi:hypothetical protein
MSHCQAATHEGDGKTGDLLVRASPVSRHAVRGDVLSRCPSHWVSSSRARAASTHAQAGSLGLGHLEPTYRVEDLQAESNVLRDAYIAAH